MSREGGDRDEKSGLSARWESVYLVPAMRLIDKTVVAVSAVFLFFLSGCGSTKYRMVENPAVPESRAATKVNAAGLELELLAVIVFDGAGSWKRKAYWDEYAVRLTNNGTAPFLLTGAVLGDVLDREVRPGGDPWALEKAGRKHEAHLQNCGAPAFAELSAMSRKKRAAATAGATALVAGVLAAGPVALYAGTAAVMVAAPVAISNWIFTDPGNRRLVAQEFKRREIGLPRELPSGGSVTGSLFFPLTPGPEFFAITAQSGGAEVMLKITLPELAELHFTYVPDKAALKAAKPTLAFLGIRPHVPERKTAP